MSKVTVLTKEKGYQEDHWCLEKIRFWVIIKKHAMGTILADQAKLNFSVWSLETSVFWARVITISELSHWKIAFETFVDYNKCPMNIFLYFYSQVVFGCSTFTDHSGKIASIPNNYKNSW